MLEKIKQGNIYAPIYEFLEDGNILFNNTTTYEGPTFFINGIHGQLLLPINPTDAQIEALKELDLYVHYFREIEVKEYYDYEKNNIFYYIIYIVMFLLYFVGFNVITHGATLGKKICRLKIVSTSSEEVKWYNYLVRAIILYNLVFVVLRIGVIVAIKNNFLTIMNSIYYLDVAFSYVIIFSILFNKDKIGIHDKLAKTKVESVK